MSRVWYKLSMLSIHSPDYVTVLTRTLWGKRERAAQWFGNVAEFEQGQNRCCQRHMTGKQRVATAVFSQHHHDKMVLHRFVV